MVLGCCFTEKKEVCRLISWQSSNTCSRWFWIDNEGLENMLNSETSRRMVTSFSNGPSEERFGKLLMENGDCTFLALAKYKRYKVSAVRDFPVGCGPFPSRIDPKTLVQTIDCSLKKENLVVSSHMYGPLLAYNEPANVQLVGIEAALEDAELTRTAKAIKCDSFNMSKSSSTVDEVVFSGGSKFLSSDVNISGSSACLEKAVTRSYFPQRRVSAVRDFPPSCGKNASHLSKGECLKGIYSLENKSVGQQKMAVDDKPLKKATATDVKEVEKNVQDGYAYNGRLVGIVQSESEGNATKKVKKLDVFESSSRMQLLLENVRQKCITISKESSHLQVEINSKTVDKEGNGDALQFEGTSGQEIIIYPEFQSLGTKPLDMSDCQDELKGGFDGLQVASDKTEVLGLMYKSECPRRHVKGSSKFNLIGSTNESNGKKVNFFAQRDMSKADIKNKDSSNHAAKKPLQKKKGNAASEGTGQLIIWEKKDSLYPNEDIEEFQVVQKSRGFNVNVPPFSHHNFSGHHDSDSNVTRNKVRETLRLFQAVCRKLLQEEESKLKEQTNTRRMVHLQAAKILKEKGKYINIGKQILGSLPGVEVGDEFQYRVELNIVGLHRQIQGGIDYVKHSGKILATSVVASGGYADELDNSDVLIYTGQGGNVMNTDKEPEDQKLKRGNLALNNSSEEKNPVRVIRGSESMDGKFKKYVYDGQYVVETYWQDMGPHDKLVFRFRLRRIPGQPELAWKEVKKSKRFKTREGLCVNDISHGKELIPICAVNTIDDKKPPPFKYITSMIYPNWCNPIPPKGCDCTNGCSDSKRCSCAVKNGGEIPFNHNGAIVEAKTLVYECGPSCKCISCYNRVSQHGIKFQLEIFKTKARGWGVRSLNSIPSGSFICEYIGELLDEKQAEQRTGNDEYLFDIGNNYSNHTLWDGLSTVMPDAQSTSCGVVEDSGFTIDAAKYGNLGRFINHSCSPNLYAQNVLYDHDDKRIPHIMLFAAESIPPLQELTYDYNYMIDQVHDSDGNIKKKDCYCGSVECTGRMY